MFGWTDWASSNWVHVGRSYGAKSVLFPSLIYLIYSPMLQYAPPMLSCCIPPPSARPASRGPDYCNVFGMKACLHSVAAGRRLLSVCRLTLSVLRDHSPPSPGRRHSGILKYFDASCEWATAICTASPPYPLTLGATCAPSRTKL